MLKRYGEEMGMEIRQEVGSVALNDTQYHIMNTTRRFPNTNRSTMEQTKWNLECSKFCLVAVDNVPPAIGGGQVFCRPSGTPGRRDKATSIYLEVCIGKSRDAISNLTSVFH